MRNRERLLRDIYAEDPERADWLVFGRRTLPDRRGFLKGAGLGAMTAALQLSEELDHAVIVTIICDRGDRYLSTGIFNK